MLLTSWAIRLPTPGGFQIKIPNRLNSKTYHLASSDINPTLLRKQIRVNEWSKNGHIVVKFENGPSYSSARSSTKGGLMISRSNISNVMVRDKTIQTQMGFKLCALNSWRISPIFPPLWSLACYYTTSSCPKYNTEVTNDESRSTRKQDRKRKNRGKPSKGYAFRNTRGLAPELVGIDSGRNAKRALRIAQKLEPKPFNGKIARYLSETMTSSGHSSPSESVTTGKMNRKQHFFDGNLMDNSKVDLVNKGYKPDLELEMDNNFSASNPNDRQQHLDKCAKDGKLDKAEQFKAEMFEDESQYDFPELEPIYRHGYALESDKEPRDGDCSRSSYNNDVSYLQDESNVYLQNRNKTYRLISQCRAVFQGTVHWHEMHQGLLSEYEKDKRRLNSSIQKMLSIQLSTNSNSCPQSSLDFSDETQQQANFRPSSTLQKALNLPQICVCGRSNVGKSSLLNAILGRECHVLRTSKKPGRTQTVQMLTVSEKLVVVDMPGYGYAQISISERKEMEKRVNEYLNASLAKRVYILVDARRGLSNLDIRFADQLERKRLIYQIVLTKMDKVQGIEKRSLIEKSIMDWINRRMCAFPDILKTSAKDRMGIEHLKMSIYLACELN